jgi:hypothetical protein
MNYRPVPLSVVNLLLAISRSNSSTELTASLGALTSNGMFEEHLRVLAPDQESSKVPLFDHTFTSYDAGKVAAKVLVRTSSNVEVGPVALVLQVGTFSTPDQVANVVSELLSDLFQKLPAPLVGRGGTYLPAWLADKCPSAHVGGYAIEASAQAPEMAIEIYVYQVSSASWRVVLDWKLQSAN